MDAGQVKNTTEIATLGGGCFWCLEPVFSELEGVENVVVGYAGGEVENPSYEQVCTGRTGHAEVVQVSFDPEEITYREILQVFFSIHDPTTRNRQGADVGPQYRSIILYHDEAQKQVAEQVIDELNQEGIWGKPIVTEVVPFETFFKAEEYHQEYYKKNPYAGYCQVVIRPKVSKFRKHYKDRLKSAS
ncbi:MAG: peptide-methionine (S)-S-oxide reductase MsrA [Anaerolineales bacterium]